MLIKLLKGLAREARNTPKSRLSWEQEIVATLFAAWVLTLLFG